MKDALKLLMNDFPVLPDKFPPIVWKHQLYAFPALGSKTNVNLEVQNLLQSSKIRCVKLQSILTANSTAIVFRKDFEKYAKKRYPSKVTDKFLGLIKTVSDSTLKASVLNTFSKEEIKELVQVGLLASDREVGNYLLTIPGAGLFTRIHDLGRKVLIRTIRSTKFNEIMAGELKQRKLPANCRFDFRFLLSDLIGSGQVESVQTPAGLLLRLA